MVMVDGADAPQATPRAAENSRSGRIPEDVRVAMPNCSIAGRGHSDARVRRTGTANAFAHAILRIASRASGLVLVLLFFKPGGNASSQIQISRAHIPCLKLVCKRLMSSRRYVRRADAERGRSARGDASVIQRKSPARDSLRFRPSLSPLPPSCRL